MGWLLRVALIAVAVLTPFLGTAQTTTTTASPDNDRWIEVRFSKDGKQLRCKRFEIEIMVGNRLLLSGKFRDRFPISDELTQLVRKMDRGADIAVRCGRTRWSLPASELRLIPATWTFSLDHGPYALYWQKEIERADNPIWIQTLAVTPENGTLGSYHSRHCPAAMRNVKPGPCFDDWKIHRERYPEKWGQ